MSNPFRKSVLDKLSSPEKLDQSIIIIAPSFWVAALGGLLVIAVALVWSIIGRLPVNVSAGGMYMGAGGLQSVVAEADGVVDAVYVSEGEEVKKGQEIAQLDSAVFDEQISALQTRKSDVESVTFWSSDDPETADTKPLLEIKSQSGLADTNLTADQIALRERSKALSKQKKSVSEARSRKNSAKKTYRKKQAGYVKAQNAYDKASEAYKTAAAELQEAINEGKTGDELIPYQKAVEEAERTLKSAESKLKSSEAAVKNAESSYSMAVQTYNTEKAAKKQLADTVSQMEAKVKADKSGTGKQVTALEKQFDATKGGLLDQINQELKKQQSAADKMTLRSRFDGRVSGIGIAEGNAVQAGMPVCMINYDAKGEETVLFLPVSEGKKIKKDMPVVVYPSTVNRQEAGHMEGKVTGVSDTVVSAQEMVNQLGDQSLAQAFQQSGPVIRVSCSLEKDENTASGYKWSSKKGAEIELDEGTIVQADIVIEEKAPITMLIPLLKEKFSVNREQNVQNNGQASQSAEGK